MSVTQARMDTGQLITQTPGICGGRPRIAGTGVSVRTVVRYYQGGLTSQEIADNFGHLTLAQVHAALAYYHANQRAMDTAMTDEEADAERLEREFLARPPA